jgi:hypothetical protein
MRILSDPSGSVEILALGIELGDPLFMEFESSEVVSILEQAELGVERFHGSKDKFFHNSSPRFKRL